MTARDDWAASVSEERVLSATQTLKKAAEWLFAVRVTEGGITAHMASEKHTTQCQRGEAVW